MQISSSGSNPYELPGATQAPTGDPSSLAINSSPNLTPAATMSVSVVTQQTIQFPLSNSALLNGIGDFGLSLDTNSFYYDALNGPYGLYGIISPPPVNEVQPSLIDGVNLAPPRMDVIT